MPTLSENLSTWRNTNQPQNDNQRGLLSLLTIDGKLYDIKDPAVEYLAQQVESRLSTLDAKTIRQTTLSKDANASKFATEVTQGVDGQITVTYGDAQTTDVQRTATAAVVGQAAEYYVDGDTIPEGKNIGDVKTPAVNPQIALSGTTTEAALIELAIAIAVEKLARENGNTDLANQLIGNISDLSTANTINAAKKYADEAVAALAGQDWSQNAKKVQEIIAELENSENGNSWLTAIDKLADMTINKTGATAAEVVEYNEHLNGAIKAGTELTAEQATAVNAAVSGANYSEGGTISAADSAAYNATLQGAITAGENTQWTDTNVTVKEYVAAEIAKVNAANAQGIADLDAVVRGNLTNGDEVSTNHKVGVKVTEVDGLITDVTVVEDDIASATDLSTLASDVESQAQVTAAALTDLDTRLTTLGTTVGNIDLTVKANKAAITTATINNWSASYTAASENLVWTNTQTTVYVPVSGQSL